MHSTNRAFEPSNNDKRRRDLKQDMSRFDVSEGLRRIRGMTVVSFLAALHYLFVLPVFAVRTAWIASQTGVPEKSISIESCDAGVDILEAAERLMRTIVAKAQCGVCGSFKGDFVVGDNPIVFDRHGPKQAACFNFQCRDCGALCGTTTCALRAVRGQIPRHVISRFVRDSDIFIPLRKPHQRADAILGFGRDLLNEMTDHAATHKSFEAFTVCFNRTQAYKFQRMGGEVPMALHPNVLRNAWFMAAYFDKSMELDCAPENVLVFSKREQGGDGAFERALEDINEPLSDEFTSKWVKHAESACGVRHQVLVGDGHVKTHFDTCDGKSGAVLIDETLGKINLACSRWPAYYGGKKLLKCQSCLTGSIVMPGAGLKETAPTEAMEQLTRLEIPDSDRRLIGCAWQDRETAERFTLFAVEWVLVDSAEAPSS
jgi:hypothetical protein